MADLLIFARPSGANAESRFQLGDIIEVRDSSAPREAWRMPPA